MGPSDPTDKQTEDALNDVLNLLRDNYDCLSMPEKYTFCINPNLRKERIDALRKAVFGMLQLENWESFQ